MTISIGYPTPEDELQMMRRFRNDLPLESVTSVISLEDILESQKRVKRNICFGTVRTLHY